MLVMGHKLSRKTLSFLIAGVWITASIFTGIGPVAVAVGGQSFVCCDI